MVNSRAAEPTDDVANEVDGGADVLGADVLDVVAGTVVDKLAKVAENTRRHLLDSSQLHATA